MEKLRWLDADNVEPKVSCAVIATIASIIAIALLVLSMLMNSG